MVNTPQIAAANGRMNSWKDIAAYLGRDVRTVIRWEEKGLPVHRVPGGKRQAVFAYPYEIDDWMNGRSTLGTVPRVVGEEERSGFVPSTGDDVTASRSTHRTEFKYSGLAAIAVGLLIGGAVLIHFSSRDVPSR